jgi:hypothetical protein
MPFPPNSAPEDHGRCEVRQPDPLRYNETNAPHSPSLNQPQPTGLSVKEDQNETFRPHYEHAASDEDLVNRVLSSQTQDAGA